MQTAKSPLRSPATLVLLAIISALPSFFVPIMHTDEGIWATLSQYVFTGDLYKNFTDHKPPLLFQMFWAFSLGGWSFKVLHFLTAVWMGIGGIALYRSLHIYLSRDQSFSAAGIFCLLSGMPSHGAFSAERAFIPFILWAAYLALKKSSHSRLNSFACGLLLGAACSVKHSAALLSLSVVICLLLIRPKRFGHFMHCFIGGLFATWLSWIAVGTDFKIIFEESFLPNFEYMKFSSAHKEEMFLDGLLNMLYVLGLQFGSVTLGSLQTLWNLRPFSPLISRLIKNWKTLPDPIILLLFIISSALTLRLGGRFYQQYYTAVLPILCVLTAFSLNSIRLRRFYWSISSLIYLSFCVQAIYLQVADKNKNWDSHVRHLIQEIQQDTSPQDSIWIVHNLQAAYPLTQRRPAIKYIQFSHNLGYADPCKASEEEIKENLDDPRYQLSLKQLKENPPKIIFLPQRKVNSCSDRIQLKRFPTLEFWLQSLYLEKWRDSLGIYYILRP